MDKKYIIDTEVKGVKMKFRTSSVLFSPKDIDKGTMAMLSVVDFNEDDKLLDLGCGYGIVGILAAKFMGASNVIMIDKVLTAVKSAKENAMLNDVSDIKIYQSNGFRNLDEKDFTLVLSNPPYHSDFSVAKEFIEKGFNRLKIGGRMYMVTKRKDWYKNKMISIFGGVKIFEVDGYFVFMAIKMDSSYADAKPRKIKKKKML